MAGVLLFERDPDLLGGAPASQAESLRRYTVEARELAVGEWNAPYQDQRSGAYALMLLEGTLSRSVTIGSRRSVELLGPGDVLRPWVEDGAALLPATVEWRARALATVAVLPEQFPRETAPCPRVMHVIADRMIMRSRWLAVDLAIGHRVGTEERLLLTFWHLGERWGRVTPDGVRVELELTHGTLADIIGARRPSVSTALGALGKRQLVEPLGEDGWLLRGPPPDPRDL